MAANGQHVANLDDLDELEDLGAGDESMPTGSVTIQGR